MDRVSSQLLHAAVASALSSAGFEGASTLGVGCEDAASDNGAGAAEGGHQDNDAAAMDIEGDENAPDTSTHTSGNVAWADLCSVRPCAILLLLPRRYTKE